MDKKAEAKMLQDVMAQLADDGHVIEAGWEAYRIVRLPENIGQAQMQEARRAFFAGAQHLFASILNILDPSVEPSEADLRRITLIDNELNAYIDALKAGRF